MTFLIEHLVYANTVVALTRGSKAWGLGTLWQHCTFQVALALALIKETGMQLSAERKLAAKIV